MKATDWIKVTDKLPELIDHCASSVFVLVYYGVPYKYLGEVRYTEVACYDYKERGWFDIDNNLIAEEVTHWMPIVLPEEQV